MSDVNIKDFFSIIPASRFFKVYAPKVMNWKHKRRGIDGNGKPITFSETDYAQMNAGRIKLIEDLKKSKL